MTTYKKLNDVITIKFNSSATNVTLSYNGSPLYFGLEDQNGNYEGNLTQTRYDLSTDQAGCSAYTINQQGSTSGTALLIVASITKNDSENQRTITYKYNNTPLFKILQSGYKYFYFNRVEISQLLVNKAVYAIANLDTGLPNSTIITTNSISMPALNFTLTETIYFFYSLTNQSTFNKYGKFTYISGGGDILGNPQNNKYQQIPNLLAKYDATTNKVTQISFSNYKNQIQYIGLYTHDVNEPGNHTYTLQAAIDFSESSKYKVE